MKFNHLNTQKARNEELLTVLKSTFFRISATTACISSLVGSGLAFLLAFPFPTQIGIQDNYSRHIQNNNIKLRGRQLNAVVRKIPKWERRGQKMMGFYTMSMIKGSKNTSPYKNLMKRTLSKLRHQ